VRVEQLYPFPLDRVTALVKELGVEEVIWCQEEPKNMGSWFFAEPRLRAAGINVRYAGRSEAASPATGSHKRHAREQAALIGDALGIHVEAGH
jgi:2-oxoglutarate dehydrogenase E1 component